MTFVYWPFGFSVCWNPWPLPAPRLASPITKVCVFLPRFVRMKVIVLPRTAWFGVIAILPAVLIVTLTVKMAGTFVVCGWPAADPATARAAAAELPITASFLMGDQCTTLTNHFRLAEHPFRMT